MLLLPGQHAHALLHEVSLQVPAGRLPVLAAGGGEPPPRQAQPRIRAGGHRSLCGEPLFRCRCGICQGDSRRHSDPHHRDQPRSRARGTAPAAHRVVSQYLALGPQGGTPATAQGLLLPPRHVRRMSARQSNSGTNSMAVAGWLATAPRNCSSRRTKPTSSGCTVRPIPPLTSRTASRVSSSAASAKR